MFLLSPDNVLTYLEDRGYSISPPVAIRELGGGVSNIVLLVESASARMVCKQALEKLRVAEDWRSRRDRTLREARAMEAVAPLVPKGSVPEIFFVDPEHWIYAMEAAPADTLNWKNELMCGRAGPSIADAAGEILGAITAGTWRSSAWEREFGDQTVFDELRLDPYYRQTARRHPECAAHFVSLIASCSERRVALVHGDWSPKNLLLAGGAVMAIDFEVAHFGNPCFDSGFLLNHLLLKSIHLPGYAHAYLACAKAFWSSWSNRLPAEASWIFEGTMAHLAGLLLARVDGKSPAEYLTEAQRSCARKLALRLIMHPAAALEDPWGLL